MHARHWMVIGSIVIFAALFTACGPKGGGDPVVSYTVNTQDDVDDGTCNASHCSLREAILAANDYPGMNKVFFDIPGAGIHRIETATGFPETSDPIVIDGTTQPGFTSAPLIELRSGVDQSGTALVVRGGNSTIQGLSIINFNVGIEIRDQVAVWVIGNYIGIRADGVTADGNQTGVKVYSGENHIGGTPLAYRNVISGNTAGVDVECESEGNLIQKNYIGLNAAGTSAVANATYGIHVCGSNNTIGGEDPLAANVISGNAGNGVEIQRMMGAPYPATGNQIVRNLIGTDATGMSALGNGQNGVFVAADGTILSGNTISGNMLNGVLVEGHQGTLITGNFIGVNSAGSHYINNVGCGVLLHNASNNWIGGGDAGAGNVISGNMNAGIKIDADPGAVAAANGIQGNKIGTNAGGTAEIANQVGIYITGNGNTVGGPAVGARNLISGNYGDGLRIQGSLNVVQLNYIGTDISGKNPLGNQFNGVRLEAGAAQNRIGTEGAGNTIAFNGGPGVVLYDDAGTGNLIQTNSIHDNEGLGIQFGTSGIPLVNDPGDTDSGPNTLINHPTMISAISQFNSQFRASLNAAPGTAYRVDFYTSAACDPSGFGEGHRHVKSVTVTTDITGLGMAVADFPGTYYDTGNYVTATATDTNGNTSEFSNCIQVVEATPTPNKVETLTPTLTKAFFTVSLSAGHVYYRGTGCGDSFVKWNVQVAEPEKVAGIWLFVRLRNKDGDGITTWGDAIVMASGGSGWYMYQLETTDIPGFVKWDNSWIQYQLVAYDKSFARVATSEVYSDLELSACHTNR